MKKMINITDCDEDIKRYQDTADMQAFCHHFGCDGFEYMPVCNQEESAISDTMICGLHMRSFSNWMDLWTGNEAALLKEFGSFEVVEQVYGGRDKEALIAYFRKDLELAKKINAEYVVFHVTEVKIEESFTYQFDYTDEEVVDAAAELINQLLDGQGYTFDFLMENLWWPGLSFTSPRITRRLIEQIHYPNKGFMLDTGHLLHTNQDLKNQEEGLRYVWQMLTEHGSLCKWIKGVHLQQSVTGAVVKEMRKQQMDWKEDYYERWCQIYEYIFQIDLHQPFTAVGVRALVEWIDPKYLTFELISRSREEHMELLEKQVKYYCSKTEK